MLKVHIILLLLATILHFPPTVLGSPEPDLQPVQVEAVAQTCQEMVIQQKQVLNDLRMLKRELALLRQEMEKPGIKDLIAGIGFIFGIFGVAAIIDSRRKTRQEKP